MKVLLRIGSLVVAALFSLEIAGCASEPTVPPRPGTIQVSVQTNGGDLDADGYEVTVGNQHRALGTNSGGSFSVPAGPVKIELLRIADNCAVVGENPRTVEVQEAKTFPIGFVVSCVATGLLITARTTGVDPPGGYSVSVSGSSPVTIAVNGTASITRLAAGGRTVSLMNTAENCAVTGDNPKTVTVVNRVVTTVTFDVVCSAVVRLEKIAYSLDSTFAGISYPRIAVANPDGSGENRIGFGRSPSWAPDGKSLVFSNASCDESYYYYYYYYCGGGLVTIDPETGITAQLDAGILGLGPAWSPTGDVIAFTEIINERIWLMSPGGTNKILVISQEVTKGRNPAWSPDGQRLALSCRSPAGGYHICIMKRDGTGYIELTSGSGIEDDPAWSPDGSRIAFTIGVAGNPQSEIGVIPAGGGSIVRVTQGYDPAWSRDGSTLVFARSDGLYSIRPDGTNLTRLTTGPHREPAWRP
jgi:hypothetical protein